MAYLDTAKTAQEVANENGYGDTRNTALDQAARARATAAGVTHSEYVDYAEGMTNYESREDVEPLAERRARDQAATFAATDFRRQGKGSGAVFTSPGDGNVGRPEA